MHVSAPSLPRHNSSTDLPSKLPAELLSAPLIWVRWGSLVPPLQPLFDGPYAVLRRGPRSFTIRVGSQDEVITVRRLKACMAADATPGSLRRRGRPPGSRQGGLATTKLRPELGGSPVESCLHPWRRSNQSGVLYPLCTVPVYKPAAIC